MNSSSSTTAMLAQKLEHHLAVQVHDDGALDLFNPSVEAIIAPFYESIRPLCLPLSEADPLPDKFNEYFTRGRSVASASTPEGTILATQDPPDFPTGYLNDCRRPLLTWSIPRPCLRVQGKRGSFGLEFRQLFIGDLVWLFFHERMGVHRMIGAVLDDFVTRGRFPLRPSGVEGLVLEAMVREVKAGLSSTVRDRDTSYRRCLGWTSESGKGLENGTTPKNNAFNTLFHRLIQLALGYYREKRLAVAIQASAAAGVPSMATLTSIKEVIGQLRKAFDPFKYGRNHTHTLSGIVWTLGALELLMRLRSQLGIPEPYSRPDELVPAAYDLLVPGARPMQGNRYVAHRQCADAGRDILLDVQALDFETSAGPNTLDDADLEVWLTKVEPTFEIYRSAYRVLTGVDFGTDGVPAIEQAAA